MPKVSVITPVFNGASCIRDAVDSILNQTLKDFELIVIDDGSTDSTLDVLASCKDSRLRVIHQNKAGQFYANNRGLAAAQGEYVAILDADDVAMPERLARQAAFLDAHPGHVMVGSFVLVEDTRTGRRTVSPRPVTNKQIRRKILMVNPFVHSTVMFRRKVVDVVGAYSTAPTYGWLADFEYWIRLAKAYEVANIPEVLVIKREHAVGVTRSLGLLEHIRTALRVRLEAIRSLKLHPYLWVELVVPFVGILLFHLAGVNKEFGHRLVSGMKR